MSFDDSSNYEGGDYTDFADFVPDEGNPHVELPEGHWGHSEGWLEWIDNLATALHGDKAMLAKLIEWLGTLDESGEQEGGGSPEAPSGEWPAHSGEWPASRRLSDPALREAALAHVRRGRESR